MGIWRVAGARGSEMGCLPGDWICRVVVGVKIAFGGLV